MSVQRDGNKAYQSAPAYAVADYGELFRCYSEEIRLLKRLRDVRRRGCEFVLVNVGEMVLYVAGGAEGYGRAVDKISKFE